MFVREAANRGLASGEHLLAGRVAFVGSLDGSLGLANQIAQQSLVFNDMDVMLYARPVGNPVQQPGRRQKRKWITSNREQMKSRVYGPSSKPCAPVTCRSSTSHCTQA